MTTFIVLVSFAVVCGLAVWSNKRDRELIDFWKHEAARKRWEEIRGKD